MIKALNEFYVKYIQSMIRSLNKVSVVKLFEYMTIILKTNG